VNLSKLESLNLSSNNIGDAGASAIAESVNLSKLESLNLSSNNIGDEGASALSGRFPFVTI
jgi:Leucine-rich repeat (LRR) protein